MHVLPWLAGLFDGEGCIGVVMDKTKQRENPVPVCSVQMSMTHEPTLRYVQHELEGLGITARLYTYKEKKNHHKDAWLLKVGRQADILTLARLMIPFAVTKRKQWKLMERYLTQRLSRPGRGITKPFTEADRVLIEEMRTMNKREGVSVVVG